MLVKSKKAPQKQNIVPTSRVESFISEQEAKHIYVAAQMSQVHCLSSCTAITDSASHKALEGAMQTEESCVELKPLFVSTAHLLHEVGLTVGL